MRRISTLGWHIYDALKHAEDEADTHKETVSFEFNGKTLTVEPLEGEASWRARAAEVMGFPILTREESAEEARLSLEKSERECAEAIAAAKAPTEAQMWEADVPWPKTMHEFTAYVSGLVDRPHDYGTCVYAMSMAAVAAKCYVASALGVTGFQSGAADMDFMRRERGMKHGFRIIDYGNLLFPQYWDDKVQRAAYQEALREPESREQFATEAERLLVESPDAAEAVKAHWRKLAALLNRAVEVR